MDLAQRLKRKLKSLISAPGGPSEAQELRQGAENRILHEDEDLTVIHRPGTGADCLVSFTGVGRAMGGIDLQTPEFSRSGNDLQKIFVIDRQRTWGNGVDWARLTDLVQGVADGGRVTTLGNSMGGFLSLLAAGRLGAEQAVAFAPQWSVDPTVVPEETRWREYRDAISAFREPDLSGAFDAPCHFHVFFGDHVLDRIHLDHFPGGRDNLSVFSLEGGGHEVGRFLKDRDLLYPLIDTCLSGRPVEPLLDQAELDYRRV